MTDPQRLRAWSDRFAEDALAEAEVEAFVRTVDDDIVAAIPEIAADPRLVEELHASTRAHWRSFLVGLGDDYRLALPPAAVALSHSVARRNLDVDVLLKVYRVAHRGVFRFLTERTASGLPDDLSRDAVLIHLWERAARWMDESVESLLKAYATTRAESQEGAIARRGEAVEAMLAGAAPTAELEAALGHPLSSWHTAFVLWGGEPAADAAPLASLARTVCELAGLSAPLTTLAGSREVWGWSASAREPATDPGAAVEFLEREALHLALGRPERGPDGFRRTHRQARAAQGVGMRADATVVDYAHHELLCLVGDSDLAEAMVRRELGPLLGEGRNQQAVRTTLAAYLRSGRDVEATAASCFVHPNTVRYRIGRAEELLGRPVAERAAALELGLAWLEMFPAADPPR